MISFFTTPCQGNWEDYAPLNGKFVVGEGPNSPVDTNGKIHITHKSNKGALTKFKDIITADFYALYPCIKRKDVLPSLWQKYKDWKNYSS